MKTSLFLPLFAAASTAILSTTIAAEPLPETAGKASDGVAVGVSARDGITISGNTVYVTRNGVTERLTSTLHLPNGISVSPTGTLSKEGHSDITLGATQLLQFDGTLVEVPLDPRVNPGDPRVSGILGSGATGGGTTGAGAALNATGGNSGGGTLGNRGGGGGTVFLDSNGSPFMGVINPNGTVTLADGTVITPSSNLRAVTFSPDGRTTLGTVAQDGSILGINGQVLAPAPATNAAAGNNQSSNVTGAVNPAVGNNAQAPTGAGALNQRPSQQGQNQQGQSQQIRPGTGSTTGAATGNQTGATTNSGGGRQGAANNGSAGGAAQGGGASGAGGASGGAAGGASGGTSGGGGTGGGSGGGSGEGGGASGGGGGR